MSKNHLKRLSAPKAWPINRKEKKWITKSNPGPHKLDESMPLNLIVKDLLKYAKTTREVKNILNKKEILINKKPVTEIKFPIGILDIIEIPKTKEYFLFLLNKKGKFFLKKINEKKSELKYLSIIGKKILKKNKIQINFYNGNNLITENKDYKIGDTLLMDLKDKKIIKHLKLEKGSTVYLKKGKYIGSIGIIENINSPDTSNNSIIEINIGEKKVNTIKKNILVIDNILENE